MKSFILGTVFGLFWLLLVLVVLPKCWMKRCRNSQDPKSRISQVILVKGISYYG
jgi:hypothetical protein